MIDFVCFVLRERNPLEHLSWPLSDGNSHKGANRHHALKVSNGYHDHPFLHLVGMGRGTCIPPSRLREEWFVTAGGRKNHGFDLLYGKTLEKIKPVWVATEKDGRHPLRPPLGARGSAARFPFA